MPPCNTQHHDSRCYICRWILSYVTFCLSQTLWYSPQVKSWWESHILLFPMLRYISGGLKPDKQFSNYITITLQITITENFKEFNTGKNQIKCFYMSCLWQTHVQTYHHPIDDIGDNHLHDGEDDPPQCLHRVWMGGVYPLYWLHSRSHHDSTLHHALYSCF